ncbi:F-box only protein 25 isoform X2 [Anthonomus grandis grandis]|uniref:F-box only protein 25 isoform X2 n=1 Tax=Anthonomus grandis grandis TaxID=2921223 RepID=UPI002166A1F7|nr:F-box only protein 25 isoform X2 [Anthonomus grandis grandis]
MPFYSKDWRSPGEEWVKTDEGWEKKKVLEHYKQIKSKANEEDKENIDTVQASSSHQPYCQVTFKSTKEIAGFNELDEAVKRLDFRSAVRDVRRFNYVCALLDHLIGQQMTGMSGCAQKALLAMLEEVARYATTSQHNPRGFRRLLNKLRALSAAERSACWGAPLGSQLLWHQNTLKINRILNMGSEFQIEEPHPDSYPKLLGLPEECLREIILRLSDHRDLTAGAQSCEQIGAIVNEQRVWRELTKFHFDQRQIELAMSKEGETDWKTVFNLLKKTYGLNEERQYAEMLSLCKYCRCLFWKSLGHPCIADQCPDFKARLLEAGGATPPAPVPPSAFLKLFSL